MHATVGAWTISRWHLLCHMSGGKRDDLHLYQVQKSLDWWKPNHWALWGIVWSLCYKLHQKPTEEPGVLWLLQEGDWSMFKGRMLLLAFVQQGVNRSLSDSSELIAIPSKSAVRQYRACHSVITCPRSSLPFLNVNSKVPIIFQYVPPKQDREFDQFWGPCRRSHMFWLHSFRCLHWQHDTYLPMLLTHTHHARRVAAARNPCPSVNHAGVWE